MGDLVPSAASQALQALVASPYVADGRRVALGAHAKDQRPQRVCLGASKAYPSRTYKKTLSLVLEP